jgi:hypothetical protein
MALAKLDDDDDTQVYDDTLLIVYQRGFADGKAAQRKPLTTEMLLDLFDTHNVYGSKWLEFARAIEQAHGIKEGK